METQFEQMHIQAMELVGKAMTLKEVDHKEYNRLMKAAFEIEKDAAYMLYSNTELEPARSIMFQSAANIASEVELYDEAHKMIYAALSGNPPQHIVNNLNDLLETIQFSRHMLQENMEMSKSTINVSLYGAEVGSGLVQYDTFKRKIDAIEKMLMRTIQRMKFPDAFVSNKLYDLKKQFPTFVQALTPGCLSVVLRLGLDESQETNLLDRDLLQSSIAEMTIDVGLLNNDDYDALKTRIDNDDYYKSIAELYNELLPDGTNLKGVNIVAQLENQTVQLNITKTKPELSRVLYPVDESDIVQMAEKGTELVLEGYLKMADNTKKEPYVKLVQLDSREYKIHLDEATIDDVVSAYWDSFVTLKVLKKGKEKLVFQEIQVN